MHDGYGDNGAALELTQGTDFDLAVPAMTWAVRLTVLCTSAFLHEVSAWVLTETILTLLVGILS